MPSQVTVIVSFQDPSGAPIAGGSVTFDLSIDISSSVSGGPQVSAGRQVTATLDSTGTAIVSLWPNDLIGSGSVYFVQAFTALGQPVWSGQKTFNTGGGNNSYILLEDSSLIWLESGEPDAILTE